MTRPGLLLLASRAPREGGARALRALALAAALVVTAIAGGSAPPADAPLALDLDVYRVAIVERAGEASEVLQPALEVTPGTLLEWWLRAWVVAGEAVPEVALDLPIPSATAYLAASAWLARLDADGLLTPAAEVPHEWAFSADDGATFAAEPLLREVRRADGSISWETVPPEAYTHVRVRIDALPVDTTLVLVARTVVR